MKEGTLTVEYRNEGLFDDVERRMHGTQLSLASSTRALAFDNDASRW